DITQLQVGQKLELECRTNRNSGAFWIRRDKSGTLHFIVFINSISRATFEGNQKTSPRFEASKHNMIYHLVVKSFTRQDEGNYFCAMIDNQMLYFSPGQPAFLPAPGGHSVFSTPTGRRMEEDVNFFCHIFIWVPLAGACLLLLAALVITLMLCQKTRRRRCRCKR
ncbi:CD8A protein, partial [Regulus satrapa]|nr:CD8A protein [Regulus satrapa]